jgi:hypothetical protein
MSRDQFVEKEEEVAEFLLSKGINWKEKGQAPVLIEGVFESDRIIEKQVKAAAKFQSAEQEAEQRKQELLAVKNRPPQLASVGNGNSIDLDGKS